MDLAPKQTNTSDPQAEADLSERQEAELQEGLDYYVENGLLVFTAAFLRRRGYCCDSGCRHCPFHENSEG